MKREEFVTLPNDVQWAMVYRYAFDSDLCWDLDEHGHKVWVNPEGDPFPNDITLGSWFANELDEFVNIKINPNLKKSNLWHVTNWNAKGEPHIAKDSNLQYAILMAFEVDLSKLDAPVFETEYYDDMSWENYQMPVRRDPDSPVSDSIANDEEDNDE